MDIYHVFVCMSMCMGLCVCVCTHLYLCVRVHDCERACAFACAHLCVGGRAPSSERNRVVYENNPALQKHKPLHTIQPD
jgi:hypothetical protein